MKLIMENWRKHLNEEEIDPEFLKFGSSGPTDKGIDPLFDRMLREKWFEAYQILHRDGAEFLDKPIQNLLRKYWKFAMKFKNLDGRFVPPQVWLDDIRKGDKSFYRQWNKSN